MRPGGFWKWAHTPSTTIAGDPRITAREHHFHGEQNSTSFRLTVEEASILQSFPPYETETPPMFDSSRHESLDLFAGSGWGVAHQRLGVKENAVEIMPQAIATRAANGMETAYHDVWDDYRASSLKFNTEIASPPCQAFSMAGNGAGRKALSQVLSVIEDGWDDIDELRTRSLEMGDERIGLVLTPLHYAWAFMPEYIVLEQVPPVLPVWQAMAAQLDEVGYSTWTGILNAEQYGVPQTRRRAILIARRDGKVAKPPTPTHSRYYSANPTKLDAGVRKWVSMAEALGWSDFTVTSNYGSGGDPKNRGTRPSAAPSATITSKADRNKMDGRNMQLDEAAALQSFPPFRAWGYTDRPSPTVTGGGGKASGIELYDQAMRKKILLDIESGSFIPNGTPVNPNTALDPMRLQPDEAARLQSYPPFKWEGSKSKQFLQIGNAVPPLLAQAILEEVWS